MPVPIKQGADKGPRGLAQVRVSEKKIKVTFEDDDVYELLPEDVPSYLKKTGKYNVTLDKDDVKMYSARPPGGSHVAKLIDFAHRDEEPPSPKVFQGGVRNRKDGTRYVAEDSLSFTALFKVVDKDSPFYEFEISTFVPYAFKDFGGDAGVGGKGQRKCEAFLRNTGLDFESDTIPFSDNVLPAVLKILLAKGAVVNLALNQDGYVDEISRLSDSVAKAFNK